MMRGSIVLVAAAAIVVLLLWLVAGPEEPGPTRSEPAAATAGPALVEDAEAPLVPMAPAPDEAEPGTAPLAAASPSAAPATGEAVSPDKLLQLPPVDPRAPLGLDVDRNMHLRVPSPETTKEAKRPALRDRVRLEHSTEAAGMPGPREQSVGKTEASVSVPVKESVDLRGGMRVNSRREGSGELEEVEPAPSVGIDVRF